MIPVKPVMDPKPDDAAELTMGSDQPQYIPLPTLVFTLRTKKGNPYFLSMSRWRFTDEERAAIAAGADVVHQVFHNVGAYPPMNLQVVDQTQPAEKLAPYED